MKYKIGDKVRISREQTIVHRLGSFSQEHSLKRTVFTIHDKSYISNDRWLLSIDIICDTSKSWHSKWLAPANKPIIIIRRS